MPQTIRKAFISAFGDESNVSVITGEIDEPGHDEVQVKVLYSGFGGSDINMRLGRYPFQKAAPLVPGYCLVGTVAQNGSGCSKFEVGTMVCAMTMYDSEAQLANVTEKYLYAVPHGLDIRKVCALILDWMTAYGLVHRSAYVKAGQKVFIHSLSGAVGMAAANLCQLIGAKVYGTASQRNHEMLRALGYEPFVYTDKNWMTAMKAMGGADVVFDPLGYESWDESYEILSHNDACLVGYALNLATMNDDGARTGKFASTLKLLSRNVMCPIQHRHTRFFWVTKDDKTFGGELKTLLHLLETGKIEVNIKAVFDLEDVQEAHRSFTKGGMGTGSMLINVGDKEPSKLAQ